MVSKSIHILTIKISKFKQFCICCLFISLQQLSNNIYIKCNSAIFITISLVSTELANQVGWVSLWCLVLPPHGVIFLHRLLEEHLQPHHSHEQGAHEETDTYERKRLITQRLYKNDVDG